MIVAGADKPRKVSSAIQLEPAVAGPPARDTSWPGWSETIRMMDWIDTAILGSDRGWRKAS